MLAEVFRQQPQVLQEISELLAKRPMETAGTGCAGDLRQLSSRRSGNTRSGFRNQTSALFSCSTWGCCRETSASMARSSSATSQSAVAAIVAERFSP